MGKLYIKLGGGKRGKGANMEKSKILVPQNERVKEDQLGIIIHGGQIVEWLPVKLRGWYVIL